MRRVIVANWKQNMDQISVMDWLTSFSSMIVDIDLKVDIVIAPPFTYICEVSEFARERPYIQLAAQDVSEFDNGPHTGEIGVGQVKPYCKYVIVGHSERKESRDVVFKKVTKCFERDVVPIECFIKQEDAVNGYAPGVIFAWEDPENISKGGVYNPKDPNEIAKVLSEIKGKLPNGTRVLYGGSVSSKNAVDLSNIDQLDGVLVGNASLDPKHFYEIVKAFSR